MAGALERRRARCCAGSVSASSCCWRSRHALTVANVVRLAASRGEDEIEIMTLVGAPLAYIRGPFVVEGVLQGGAGALLAMVLLWLVFAAANARYGTVAAQAVGPGSDYIFASVSSACCCCLAGWCSAASADSIVARAVSADV